MTGNYRIIRTENKRRFGFGIERMKEIKVCEHCGAVAAAGRVFCPDCAKLLPRETVYAQYQKRHRCCKGCGTVVSNRMNFCPDCGQKLD